VDFFDGIEKKTSEVAETTISTLSSLILGKENSLVSLIGLDLSGDYNEQIALGNIKIPSINTALNFAGCLGSPALNLFVDVIKPIIEEWNTGSPIGTRSLGEHIASDLMFLCVLLNMGLIIYPLIEMAGQFLTGGKSLNKFLMEQGSKTWNWYGKYTPNKIGTYQKGLNINIKSAKFLYWILSGLSAFSILFSFSAVHYFEDIGASTATTLLYMSLGLGVIVQSVALYCLIRSKEKAWQTWGIHGILWGFQGFKAYQIHRINNGDAPLSLF